MSQYIPPVQDGAPPSNMGQMSQPYPYASPYQYGPSQPQIQAQYYAQSPYPPAAPMGVNYVPPANPHDDEVSSSSSSSSSDAKVADVCCCALLWGGCYYIVPAIAFIIIAVSILGFTL